MKPPQVVFRKLGREKAAGLAHIDDHKIEIDPRQSPRDILATCIHEAAHIAFPKMSEEDVVKLEKIAPILWKIGYRLQ